MITRQRSSRWKKTRSTRYHSSPTLAAHEAERAAELQQEGLELLDERVFELELRVLVLEVEELENEWVLDRLVGRHCVRRLCDLPLRQHSGPIFRKQRSLVELALDLPIELSVRPPTAEGLALVEAASARLPHREEPHVVRPGEWKRTGKRRKKLPRCALLRRQRQLSRCRLDNLAVPEKKGPHLKEVRAPEASSEAGGWRISWVP